MEYERPYRAIYFDFDTRRIGAPPRKGAVFDESVVVTQAAILPSGSEKGRRATVLTERELGEEKLVKHTYEMLARRDEIRGFNILVFDIPLLVYKLQTYGQDVSEVLSTFNRIRILDLYQACVTLRGFKFLGGSFEKICEILGISLRDKLLSEREKAELGEKGDFKALKEAHKTEVYAMAQIYNRLVFPLRKYGEHGFLGMEVFRKWRP